MTVGHFMKMKPYVTKIKPNMYFFCNSWMHVFNQLGGMSPKYLSKRARRPPLAIARDIYARPSAEDLVKAVGTSISFIVGRHPFERLVSGYRDKILLALKGKSSATWQE